MTASTSKASSSREPGFTQKAVIAVAVFVAFAALAATFVLIADALLIFFGAILLALSLRRLGEFTSKMTRLSPKWGFIVGTTGLGVILLGATLLISPYVANEFQKLGPKFDEAVTEVTDRLEEFELYQDLKSRVKSEQVSLGGVLSSGTVPKLAQKMFSGSIGFITGSLLILFVGLWLAWKPGVYLETVIKLCPLSYRDRLRSILIETGESLTNWVVGRLVAMLTVGVATTGVLLVLGVPMPFVLGLITGLVSFVPTIGAVLAIIPALLLAVPQGMGQVGAVLIGYLIIQQIENNLVTPLVMQQAVSIPPAFALMTQLAFGTLFGGLGVAFAVPLAAATMTLTKRLYVEDILGDDEADEVNQTFNEETDSEKTES